MRRCRWRSKRVRLNAEKSGVGFEVNFGELAAMAGGEGGGPVGGFGGGSRDDGDGGYSPRNFGDGGSMPQDPGSGGVATVEIQGIVYIYNPPDPAILSVPGAEEPAGDNVAATGSGTTSL